MIDTAARARRPITGPRAEYQINLTDPDSRILPAAGGGFEESYNAQAAVDTDTMLVVATGLSQAANDKQQITPMVETLGALPEELGEVSGLLADAGYFSEASVAACVEADIDPFGLLQRGGHVRGTQSHAYHAQSITPRVLR